MAGRFSVEATFKAIDRITAPVSRMQNRVGKFTRGMKRGLRSVNRTLDKTIAGLRRGAAAAVRFAAVGIAGIAFAVGGLVKQFSKIEDAEAAFTPLLRSADKARILVEQINKTAATTPFQFKTLADTANQLLPVMNGNIEDTIKNIRMLGDTAGGNAQKLESITRGFTKAMLKGKPDMESLNMIAEAGVPIFTEMADSMGISVSQLFALSKQSKLTKNDLVKTFERMTSSGGIFFKGMEIASLTTSGIISTMKDNISLAAAEIGAALAPVVKDLAKQVTLTAAKVKVWAEANKAVINANFIKFIDGVKVAISGLVSFFGFLAEHKTTITIISSAILGMIVVIKALTLAMAILEIVAIPVLAPFLAIAGVIIGITAAISLLSVALGKVLNQFEVFQKIKNAAFGIGFKSDEEAFGSSSPSSAQVVSPQDRISRSIEQTSSTSKSEVVIRDESRRAEVTSGKLGGGLTLIQSGAFE